MMKNDVQKIKLDVDAILTYFFMKHHFGCSSTLITFHCHHIQKTNKWKRFRHENNNLKIITNTYPWFRDKYEHSDSVVVNDDGTKLIQ